MRQVRAAVPGSGAGIGGAFLQRDTEAYRAALEGRWPDARVSLDRQGRLRTLSAERAALSAPAEGDPVDLARRFLAEYQQVFGLTEQGIEDLRLTSQTSEPGLALVSFRQTAQGLPVYGGDMQLALNASGQVTRVNMGQPPPGEVDPNPALSAEEAARIALEKHGLTPPAELAAMAPDSEGRLFFENPVGPGLAPIRVELVAFPLGPTETRPAYRIFLEVDDANWFEILLDAGNGNLLLRRNLYHSVAQGRVWKISPTQGPRALVNFPEGWLGPGQTRTTGNNADAYIANLGSGPDLQNGRAVSPSQVFDFAAGEGSTGQDPTEFRAAAVTNLFYFANDGHDYFYGLGFTEAAGNFQTDNFGRGGLGNDAVRVEAQGVYNNAGFAATPDGMAPRARFGLFDLQDTPQPTDDRDSSYDASVVIHELAHGLTTRLIGGPDNIDCLFGIQSSGLGEGWSDYFGASYTNSPVAAAYISGNADRGLRRYSYEGYPLTYEDLGNIGWLDPHDDGEIWAATLWDLRKQLGKQTADQLVARGLKLTPCDPSMTDARDAILQADANTGSAQRAKLWEVFARHGLGNAARGVDGDNFLSGTVFTAAFDRPLDLQAGNRTPLVTSEPDLAEGVGRPFQYNIAASDPDGDALTYSLVEGPPGLSVNGAGRVSWTSTFTGQRVKVRVTDGKGGQAIHGFFVPVLTLLSPGVPVPVGGDQDTFGYAAVLVPGGTPVLQITMRGGSGDPDLLTVSPAGDVGGFSREGSTETFSIASPPAGAWLIQLSGAAAYAGVALKAALLTPTVIEKDSTLRNRSGDETSETFFRVTVPPGTPVLRVTTSGGTGDADLFVKRGSVPVCQDVFLILVGGCEFDELSVEDGNAEVVEIPNPQAGEWYIDLVGYTAYSGLNLTVDFSASQPAIKSGGIVLATQTPTVAQAAARSIISVFGGGFAPAGTLVTEPTLDSAGQVSTVLAGTCLEINGNRSPMFAVLPTQVNAQISEKVMPGNANAVVVRGCGTPNETRSAPMGFVVTAAAPAFFNFINQASGVNPIAAVHGGGPALVGAPGLLPGAVFTPAEPNGIVSAFGSGFGGTEPAVPAGAIPATTVPDGVARATGAVSLTVGGIPVPPEDIFYVGTAPCCAGLDQLVFRVPSNAPDGDLPVRLTIGGISSPAGPYITVKRP